MIEQIHQAQKARQQLGRGLICLSLAGADADALIRKAKPLIHLADLVEIRLDSMLKPAIAPFIEYFKIPVLATNRPHWEGGNFQGSEEERILLLEKALAAGAAYVDIELRTEPCLRDAFLTKAKALGAWALVSWHDFSATPDSATLQKILTAMRGTPARSGKIVSTAATKADALRLMGILEQAQQVSFPLSAFPMGAPGGIIRLASLYLGGHISYASLHGAESTAPGQISISRLRALCDLFEETA